MKNMDKLMSNSSICNELYNNFKQLVSSPALQCEVYDLFERFGYGEQYRRYLERTEQDCDYSCAA